MITISKQKKCFRTLILMVVWGHSDSTDSETFSLFSGTTTSLFGYKINTPNSAASLIKLKKQILAEKDKPCACLLLC